MEAPSGDRPLPVLSAPALIERLQLRPILQEIETYSSLDARVFEAMMAVPLRQFAELVQLAPASEYHHHCGPGGLLTHTFDVIRIALKRRRAYQLPFGAGIGEIRAQQHLWTYAVFAACLLHDLGKLTTTIRIVAEDAKGRVFAVTPQDPPLTDPSRVHPVIGYRIRFERQPYVLHQRLAMLQFGLLPSEARGWLMQSPLLLTELTAYLWGDRYESGAIGEICEWADGESVARAMDLPSGTRFSRTIAPAERLMGFFRALIADGRLRVNTNGGMLWVDGEGHCYAVCRALAETLLREASEHGVTNVPTEPTKIYDLLQEYGYALPTAEGRAIWTIRVRGPSFEHAFTCLKFEARRLTTPRRTLVPFDGRIEVMDTTARAAAETRIKHETESATGAEAGTEATETAIKRQTETESETPLETESQAEATERSSVEPKLKEAMAAETVVETEAAWSEAEIKKPTREHEDGDRLIAGSKRPEVESRPSPRLRHVGEAELGAAPDTESEAEKTPVLSSTPALRDTVLEAEVETALSFASDTIVPDRLESDSMHSGTAQKVSEPVANVSHGTTPIVNAEYGVGPSLAAQETPFRIEGFDPASKDAGRLFLNWLQQGLMEKRIVVNNPKAAVHIVKEGVFLLSPKIWKDFLELHGFEPTREVHRNFARKVDRLRVAIPNAGTGGYQQYWVCTPTSRKALTGMLLPFDKVYLNDYPVPAANKYLVSSKEINGT